MKKSTRQPIFFFLVFPFIFSGFLSACGLSSGGGEDEKVPVTLRFQVQKTRKLSFKLISDPSAVTSMQITVTGPGMPPIDDTFDISPGESVSRILNVLPGPGRIFTARVFDDSNTAIFSGESDPVDILPASSPAVSITLKALFLNLFSELPRFSANYILNDVPGISPFSGLSTSQNYSAGVGLVAVRGKIATSENYTLR